MNLHFTNDIDESSIDYDMGPVGAGYKDNINGDAFIAKEKVEGIGTENMYWLENGRYIYGSQSMVAFVGNRVEPETERKGDTDYAKTDDPVNTPAEDVLLAFINDEIKCQGSLTGRRIMEICFIQKYMNGQNIILMRMESSLCTLWI